MTCSAKVARRANDDVMHANHPSCRHRVGIPPPTWEFDSAEHKEVDSPGSEHYDLATLVSSAAPLFVSFGDPKSSRSSKSSRSQTRDPKMVTLDPKTVKTEQFLRQIPLESAFFRPKLLRTHERTTDGRTHMKNLRHSHNRPFGQLHDEIVEV